MSLQTVQANPLQTPTLASVTLQFSDWRAARGNKRSRVPGDLRQQAMALLDHYPQSHVIEALRINSQMLKNWQQALLSEPSSEPSSDFVELTSPGSYPVATRASSEQSVEFTLRYASGQSVHCQGSLTLDQITALARGLCPDEVRA